MKSYLPPKLQGFNQVQCFSNIYGVVCGFHFDVSDGVLHSASSVGQLRSGLTRPRCYNVKVHLVYHFQPVAPRDQILYTTSGILDY